MKPDHRRWDELRSNNLREVPSAPAVYVVFRPTVGAPTFLDTNPGGRFKEKDPTVPIEVLSANWVPSSQVERVCTRVLGKLKCRTFYGVRFGTHVPMSVVTSTQASTTSVLSLKFGW